MGSVRVAAVQLEATEDVQRNLLACLRLIDDAAARGAQLIVLPEFCNHLSWYLDRADAHAKATRPGDGFLSAIAAKAAEHQVFIKVNVTHAYPDGRTGGTNFLFGRSGEILGSCDKQTLMGSENDFLNPAAEVGPIVDTELGRLGLYACMEGVIFEVARGLALRGAQILLNSLNSFAVDEASLHIPVRAAENKVWVVAANKIGPLLPAEHLPQISAKLGVPPEWLHGAGESQIVAPDGTVVAKGPRTGEAVVIADIDPSLADSKLRPDGADIFAIRRPERYGSIADQPKGRSRSSEVDSLPVAVVRDPVRLREAALAGAQLIVLAPAQPGEATTSRSVASVAAALWGTDAVAVVPHADAVVPDAVGDAPSSENAASGVQQADGVAARLVDAHGAREHADYYDLPWGRLAVVEGDDVLTPEAFRVAALSDVDVAVALFTPQESWELALGLPERAAENRMNVIAATPAGHPGGVFGLSPDFTLWTQWQGPFTGRISHPLVTEIKPDEVVAHAVVAPAQADNRLVSRNTNLVDGRPWRLVQAIVER